MIREFIEETGYTVKVQQNLGTFDFFIRHNEDHFTHMHHLAALYKVELTGEEGPVAISIFEEQDSRGAEWVDITRITLDSASPLAVYAAKFLRGEELPVTPEYYDDWEVKGT